MSWRRWLKAALPALLLAGGVPSSAAGAEKAALPPITIAVPPEKNVFEQVERFLPLENYLNRKLSRPVRFKVQRSYHDALEQIRKGEVDGGWLGSAPGVYAYEAAGYLPVARMEDLRGDSFYRSSIFRRQQSGVTADPSTWRGKVFAFPSRTTSAGFLYPVAYMRARGVREPLGFLSSASIFTGSHDTALWAVANGRAELGACKSTVFNSVMDSNPEIRGKVEVIHVGGSFPLDSLFLKPSLGASLRGEIGRALLAMEADPEAAPALKRLGARRMVANTREDYQEVYRTLKDAGYDIKGFLALMEAER